MPQILIMFILFHFIFADKEKASSGDARTTVDVSLK